MISRAEDGVSTVHSGLQTTKTKKGGTNNKIDYLFDQIHIGNTNIICRGFKANWSIDMCLGREIRKFCKFTRNCAMMLQSHGIKRTLLYLSML